MRFILFITLLVTFITGCTFQPTLRIGETQNELREVYAGEYIITRPSDGPFNMYPKLEGNPVFPAGTPTTYAVERFGNLELRKPTASILSAGTTTYREEEDFCLINKIENCEPNWVLKTQEVDPLLPTMWNYREFNFEKAWTVKEDSPEIKVMVLDTGVDCKHEDIDCEKEYDAINSKEGEDVAQDENGHGTHCAGSVGGHGDNGKGIAGVSKRTKIYAAKFLGASGSGSTFDAVKGVRWGIAQEVDVISMSFGGGARSSALESALRDAHNKGIALVGAAGNDGRDTDQRPSYPANYENVISIASNDSGGELSSFSNYGATSVDGSAPGGNILSLQTGGGYRRLSGTSMATPHVSGLLALLLSTKTHLPKVARRDWAVSQLFATAEPAHQGKVRLGRFDAGRALTGEAAPTPVPVCKVRPCKKGLRECNDRFKCACGKQRKCKTRIRKETHCRKGCS